MVAEATEDIRQRFAALLRDIIKSQEELLEYLWLKDDLRTAAESLLKNAQETLVSIEGMRKDA